MSNSFKNEKSIVKRLNITLTSLFLLFISANAIAQDTMDIVKQKVEGELGFPVTAISESPVPGLLQLTTERG